MDSLYLRCGSGLDGMTHGGKIGAFVESSPHPAWLASSDGICTYANPALQRLTGLNSHQIELHDWLRFVVDEDREAARTSWKLSVATQHLIVPGFALWDLTAFRLKSSSQRSATRLIKEPNSGCSLPYIFKDQRSNFSPRSATAIHLERDTYLYLVFGAHWRSHLCE